MEKVARICLTPRSRGTRARTARAPLTVNVGRLFSKGVNRMRNGVFSGAGVACGLAIAMLTFAGIGPVLADQDQRRRTITEAERNFLGAAGSYLKTANDQGMKVARAMAGVQDGSSTLGDIRAAISKAQLVENAGYHGDYRSRIKGNVPSSLAHVQKQIEETHRLFQAAMSEYLEYWKDSNAAHLVSGNRTFERCVLVMNVAIEATNSEMKELKLK